MASIIVRAPADSLGRKATKKMGRGFLDMMMHGKKTGDHIEITETIAPGAYTFGHSETPEGHISIDLTSGKEP
jgi:lambda family phage tail tape measure protein